ncbi:MAG: PqqD family protein [Casimicrobium sp.]
MSKQVGEELVLLDLNGGVYYGLNAVGARFWALLNEERSLASIRDTLLSEFETTSDVIERDLADLVSKLSAKGLIRALP